MGFDFQEMYKQFEKVKSEKEFMDYCNDINENTRIIYKIPFDEEEAIRQISRMSGKYKDELNWLAGVYGNGMNVVQNVPKKDEPQLKQELYYINNQIPIIALMRELDAQAFHKILGIE